MKKIPATINQFVGKVTGETEKRQPWRLHFSDLPDAPSFRAWLEGFDPVEACITFEHGTLWVNLDHGDYFFELGRLHEDHPAWTWRQQLAEKEWATGTHFALLDALVHEFPAAVYARVVETQS